jgi:hypothetical protein
MALHKVCKLPLSDECVQLDKADHSIVHDACFSCAVCHRDFDDVYWQFGDKLLCQPHYFERTELKCTVMQASVSLVLLTVRWLC